MYFKKAHIVGLVAVACLLVGPVLAGYKVLEDSKCITSGGCPAGVLITDGSMGCDSECGGSCFRCAGSSDSMFCKRESNHTCHVNTTAQKIPCGAKTEHDCAGSAPDCTCSTGAGVPAGTCELSQCVL